MEGCGTAHRGFAACGVAHLARQGDLPAAATFLVRQHGPEFVAKAADIVGLYLAPPTNALVICVDEKPSIQALGRATGYVETESGKIVRGFKST